MTAPTKFGLCLVASAGIAFGQAAPTASATTAKSPSDLKAPESSEVVTLSEFTVQGTLPSEYAASESLTGSRSATAIRDLPNDVVVVTSEFMKDFGLFDFDRALSYTSSFSAEEVEGQYNLRGFTGGSQLMNGFRRGGLVESNNIERAEVLKGPMAAIYGQTSPGGAVNIIPKRPSSRKPTSSAA
jgi:outer membrane receptor protein involved in Fe transport